MTFTAGGDVQETGGRRHFRRGDTSQPLRQDPAQRAQEPKRRRRVVRQLCIYIH